MARIVLYNESGIGDTVIIEYYKQLEIESGSLYDANSKKISEHVVRYSIIKIFERKDSVVYIP